MVTSAMPFDRRLPWKFGTIEKAAEKGGFL
jgi:hypothetical protein